MPGRRERAAEATLSKTRSRRALVAAAPRLDRRLELAACRELRHRGCGNLDFLAGPRIDPHARRAVRRRELAESGEVHRASALEYRLDRVQEGVDRLAGVRLAKARAIRHLVHELLLRHQLLLPSGSFQVGISLTPGSDWLNHAGFAGILGGVRDIGRSEQ